MTATKALFDAIRDIKGKPLTQAEVDRINALFTAPGEPKWLTLAKAEIGVKETPGPTSTPRVVAYRKQAGIELGGDDGVLPWCAIFVIAMLRQAGVDTRNANAMARSLLNWGQPVDSPIPGAIIVYKSATRPAPLGHTNIATGRITSTHVEGVGGNQGDAVSVALFDRKNVLGYRWPLGVPIPSVKPVTIASGPVKQVSDA